MPYPASWVLFDQLFRQFNRGLLSEGEYLSERWDLDYRYEKLLEARGLLDDEELLARQQQLHHELQPLPPPGQRHATTLHAVVMQQGRDLL